MSDEPTNGRRWRLPISPPPDAESMLVPWWIPPLFVILGLALAPWIVWLFVSLPSQEVANNWEVAWGGFDVALGALLAATGISLARRGRFAGLLASMTAGLLLADAWFDTITSRGTGKLALALLEAFCVEVPLALVCLWIVRNIERVLADARPFLVRAGFRIERRRLVPPDTALEQED
ncbi:MAG TPA: hypothetical protein VMS63_06925 [Gaiellaceae bacterium]|jgi:hypothetical protein|nr:hypothetical protein [Gaiellaceae bacterium]